MYIPHMGRRVVNSLRRPYIQRLIILAVSTLLAMSLGYATMLLIPSRWGKDVALFLPGSPAIVACLDVASGQVLHRRAFVSAQMMAQLTEQHAKRRPV
ncbi:MAG TPA: hypothetical protein VH593_02620 [Ktedonobacteraceae bacterium]